MTKPQSIGVLLKAAREKKGLSIEKVHQDTKMLPRIIIAMEEDALDKIGAKAYQESFLKKYARYLGVEAYEEIASASKMAATIYREPAAGGILNKMPAAEEAPPRWIVPAVVMFVSLAAIIFLGAILLTSVKTAHKNKDVQAKTLLSNKAVNKPQANSVTSAKLLPLVSKDEVLRLKLYAKEDVWIKVRSDGKIISQGVLPKGSRELLEAKSRFNIWAGKIEALSFTVNDNLLDIKGKGVVKDIRITRDSIEMRR